MPTDVLSPNPSGDKPATASFQPTGPLRWPPEDLRLEPRERAKVLGRILRLALRGHAGERLDLRDTDLFALACLASDVLAAVETLPGEPGGAA